MGDQDRNIEEETMETRKNGVEKILEKRGKVGMKQKQQIMMFAAMDKLNVH